MAMRLQEIHPALVHFPITLLPVALGADLLGRATGSEPLTETGRRLMPLAAGAAALFGLVAQEEVKAEGQTHDMLVTHRNLNLGLVGLATAMAAWRARAERPSAAYLALAGLGVMSYAAYLGGHMVYEHGPGVRPAGGLRDGGAPALTPGSAGEATRRTLADVRHGATHATEHIREGNIAPALTGGSGGGGAQDGSPGQGALQRRPAGES